MFDKRNNNCLSLWSAWVQPHILLGFMVLNHFFSVYCFVDLCRFVIFTFVLYIACLSSIYHFDIFKLFLESHIQLMTYLVYGLDLLSVIIGNLCWLNTDSIENLKISLLFSGLELQRMVIKIKIQEIPHCQNSSKTQ
jgi:hypothetical protein